MENFWWQTVGIGNCHLVLLHGWGLNAGIWSFIQKELASQFILHLVDLPGFGRSQGYGALSLDEMAQCVLEHMPQKAIWLGWSLGGLVASQAALTHPERVQALITVSSSPCFIAHKTWPGISIELLADFQKQLSDDFQRAVERFLALQTIGTETVRQDARTLKKIMLTLPIPSIEVLNGGLEILKTANLCEALTVLRLPHLRLYGYLDSLVPRSIAPLLDTLWPYSESIMIAKAAHAPFISHPSEFCTALTALIQRLTD